MVTAFAGKLTGLVGRRERRIMLASLGGLIFKFISMLTLLVSVPLTYRYLGPERYGMWMTLTSFSVILAASDFGVGAGLMTALASESGRDDQARLRSVISNGFAVLGVITCSAMLLFLACAWWIDWAAVFHVTSAEAVREARPAAVAFVLSALIGIPAALGQRVMIGLQRGARAGLWAGAGSVAQLVALLVAVKLRLSLPMLVLCFVGVPTLVNAVSTWVSISGEHVFLRPRIDALERREVIRLCKSGFLFFALQIIAALTFSADNIVVAQVLDARAVASYSVADRMYQMIIVAMTMINAPLWPAYAEASARGDREWIRVTFLRSMLMNAVLAGGAAIVLLAFGTQIVTVWVATSAVPTLALSLALAVRRVTESIGLGCSMLLNGLHVARFQLFWGCAMAAASVALRVLFIKHMGLPGGPWGVTAAVVAFGLVPNLIFITGLFRHRAAVAAQAA